MGRRSMCKKNARMVREVIGLNIIEVRLEKGYTQRELAMDFGAHESYFRGIETGSREFSLSRLAEISDLLGVTMARLVEGL